MCSPLRRTIDLNTSFLRLLAPVLFVYSVVMIGFFVWHDTEINEQSKNKSERLVFETFYSSLRQPLLQGSHTEARFRADELMKNPQVLCVDLKIRNDPIVQCKAEIQDKFRTHRISRTYKYEETGDEFATLSVVF